MRALLDMLFPPRMSELAVRDLSLQALAAHLSPTTVAHCPNTTALFPYRDPIIESLVIEAKFHNSKQAQKLLGAVLSDYISDWCNELAAFEAVRTTLVPVPLSPERHRNRGYNQLEQILKQCPEAHSIQNLLKRTRNTRPQTSLSKEARLQNMKDAFDAVGSVDSATIYIVIDDVVTTGATMRAAQEAMQKAGAGRVYGLALAH